MILSATLGTDRRLPQEYIEYRLCQEFGWTPDEIENMDAGTIDLYIGFMNLEAKQGLHSQKREKHYRG